MQQIVIRRVDPIPSGTQASTMGCPRCQNPMVGEIFIDLQSDASPSSFVGWRCVICGAILDPIIQQHQKVRPKPGYGRARAKKAPILAG